MAQKISNLESKVKEMDSKATKSIIIKEPPNNVADAKTYQKGLKDLKEKKENLKGSVFKFGDEARNTVSDKKKAKE